MDDKPKLAGLPSIGPPDDETKRREIVKGYEAGIATTIKFWQAQARVRHGYFVALTRQGFTDAQALAIVIADKPA